MKIRLFCLILMVSFVTYADVWTDPATGIAWTYTVSGGKASVGGGSYTSPAVPTTTTGALTIPSKINGYSVTSIGGYAFYGCSGLTSVTIPDSVTSIGSWAFYGCSGLTSVHIADLAKWCGISFGEQGSNPLLYANNLYLNGAKVTSLTIPDSVTSIGNYAFEGCGGLTSVTISDGVTSIGERVFFGCSGLTSVTIPDSVTSIGNYAFYYCSGLTNFVVGANNHNYCSVNGLLLTKDGKTLIAGINGDVTIPDSVTSIGSSAFSGCSGLTSVTIPDSVTSIGDSAFENCSSLTSVTIPDGVTSIGNCAFYYCSGLTSVTIGNGVTSIGYSAFEYCSSLTSVTIGNSVMSIGDWAFYNCSGLTSVTIPDGVTSIGGGAFFVCRLVFSGAPPSWVDQFSNSYSCLFAYPLECEAQWKPLLKKSYVMVRILSSTIRESDPTILDTRFIALKSGPIGVSQTVKIRVLAFEDGTRSFAKVVRPETFVDGTAPANWDAVEANVAHTLSWKVSSDWATRLAKVKFEILASDGDLLPLELRTIPASDQYGKMKISWNAITESQVFDALLWQYADKDPGLTLAGGVLRNGGVTLASGAQLSGSNTYYDENGNYVGSHWLPNSAAPAYVLGKMGYQLLTGAPLSYANSETRLNLRPYGVRQYAYKIVEE